MAVQPPSDLRPRRRPDLGYSRLQSATRIWLVRWRAHSSAVCSFEGNLESLPADPRFASSTKLRAPEYRLWVIRWDKVNGQAPRVCEGVGVTTGFVIPVAVGDLDRTNDDAGRKVTRLHLHFAPGLRVVERIGARIQVDAFANVRVHRTVFEFLLPAKNLFDERLPNAYCTPNFAQGSHVWCL